jgi:Rrf2 family protein
MQLRNQVEWALHCCVLLAGLEPDQTLPTKVLAEFHRVPKEYLSKALQALSQAGLVEGALGPAGGYRLAKPAAKISFLDVVLAVEGDARNFACTEIRANNPCLPKAWLPAIKSAPCGIAQVMWSAEEAWRAKLAEVAIADIAKQLERKLPAQFRADTKEWLSERS